MVQTHVCGFKFIMSLFSALPEGNYSQNRLWACDIRKKSSDMDSDLVGFVLELLLVNFMKLDHMLNVKVALNI